MDKCNNKSCTLRNDCVRSTTKLVGSSQSDFKQIAGDCVGFISKQSYIASESKVITK